MEEKNSGILTWIKNNKKFIIIFSSIVALILFVAIIAFCITRSADRANGGESSNIGASSGNTSNVSSDNISSAVDTTPKGEPAEPDNAEVGDVVGYVVVNDEGRYGIIDVNGDFLVEPKEYYKIAETYKDGLITAFGNNTYSYIDIKGNKIIETDYYTLGRFYDGVAAVCTTVDEDKEVFYYSYLSRETGKLITDKVLLDAKNFSGGLAVVCDGETDLYGFLGLDGEYSIEPQYDDAGSFKYGLAPVTKDGNGLYGYIDTENNMVIEPQYLQCGFFDGDGESALARVYNKKGKWGFIDREGKTVIKFVYDEAKDFSEGYAVVYKDKNYGVINRKGETVVDFEYDSISDCSEGLFCVQKDGKYGYVNTKGEVVVELQYEFATDFCEGLAGVTLDGVTGYINTSGELEIPYKFAYVGYFLNGYAVVSDGTKEGIIDRSGNYTVIPQYYSVTALQVVD